MIYATINEVGLPTGFYDSAMHPVIPEGAVEIGEDVWAAWIGDTERQRWDAETAALVAYDPPPPPPVVPARVTRTQAMLALLLGASITEQMIRDRIALIEDATEREVMRLRFEQATWLRDSEFIGWGAEQFALSAEEVDGLFVQAVTA